MTADHGSTDDTKIRLTAAADSLDCEYRERYTKTAEGTLTPMPGAIEVTGDTFVVTLPLDVAAQLRDQLIELLHGRGSAHGYAQMVRDYQGTALGRILEKAQASGYAMRRPSLTSRSIELSKPGALTIVVYYGLQGGLSNAWPAQDVASETRSVNTVLSWFGEADTTH